MSTKADWSRTAIYLRDHEAAAHSGLDLFRRATAGQRGRAWSDTLQELTVEVEQDLQSLHALMRAVGVRPNPLLALAAKLAERVGRLKPNGRLLGRAALSDLIEVEGLLDAAWAKRNGWQAMAAARLGSREQTPDLAELIDRADRQVARLTEVHRTIASALLAPGPVDGDVGTGAHEH